MTLEGLHFSKRFIELTALLVLCFLLRCRAENSTITEQTKAEVETEKPAPVLTGIPQKDYIHDPNLPRELKGFNLSDYPFYKRVPNVEFNFSCDLRKDGFYASIPHKCQVYHHCLFEVRYDFLCPNYTAFDQSKFICHFANEVDCENSEMYFDRNDALYVEETTTTTTTAAPQVKIVYIERNSGRRPNHRKTTASPADDYYYDYDYDEPSAIATTTTTTTTTSTSTVSPKIRRRPNRPLRVRPKPEGEQLSQSTDYPQYDIETPQRRPTRIRGGARIKEQQQQQSNQEPNQEQPQKKRKRRRRKKTTSTTTTTTTSAPEYYDEYYYDDYYDAESSSTTSTTTTQKPLLRRRPDQTSRLTSQDRRKALLQSRKSQVQRFARPTPSKSQQTKESKPQNNFEYDDTVYTDYIT